MRELMIDIEALSTKVGAIILQIGMMEFSFDEPISPNLEKLTYQTSLEGPGLQDYLGLPRGSTFVTNVSVESCCKAGGIVDDKCLNWWTEQGGFHTQGIRVIPIDVALELLSSFYHGRGPCERVWAKGTHYDIANLEFYYTKAGKYPPWKYNTVRDIRTFTDCAKAFGWKPPELPEPPHRADLDCVLQVVEMQSAMRFLIDAAEECKVIGSLV